MANWLSDRRKHLRYTQDHMVELLSSHGVEITRAALSHWENGRNSIPIEDVEIRTALAKVLNISNEELLRVSGYGSVEENSYDSDAIRAADIVHSLSPDRKRLALNVLEQFASAR